MAGVDSIEVGMCVAEDLKRTGRSGKLFVVDAVIDPARAKELLNPEFVPDGPFLLTSNDRGRIGYRYEPLPAVVAAEPTAFGCLFVEGERLGGPPALIAILWDGFATKLHKMSPVVCSNSTVAKAGSVTSAPGEGRAA